MSRTTNIQHCYYRNKNIAKYKHSGKRVVHFFISHNYCVFRLHTKKWKVISEMLLNNGVPERDNFKPTVLQLPMYIRINQSLLRDQRMYADCMLTTPHPTTVDACDFYMKCIIQTNIVGSCLSLLSLFNYWLICSNFIYCALLHRRCEYKSNGIFDIFLV